MVTLARRVHRIPFAPVVALMFGIVCAILVAAVPQWMFEAGVVASGLPTVLAAASPPLGVVARLLAIALAFGAGTVAVWALVAPLSAYFEAKARARTPWRDAGYDAQTAFMLSDPLPPRRPIFAPDELGAPLMSDAAIAPTPVLEPAPALAAPLAAGELRTVIVAPTESGDSITDLIRRLENGLTRRASNDRDPDGAGNAAPESLRDAMMLDNLEQPPTTAPDNGVLDQALGSLRRLATR